MTAPTSPALPFPVLPDASVESCIVALVAALQQSKGWMHGYADAIVRDAVDRAHLGASPLDVPHHPEPHTHTWTEMEKRCILAWGGALVARQAAEKDAELQRLRADAERFAWLLDNANIDFDPSEPYQLVIWEPGTGQDWKAITRAAIDASRALAQKEAKS